MSRSGARRSRIRTLAGIAAAAALAAGLAVLLRPDRPVSTGPGSGLPARNAEGEISAELYQALREQAAEQLISATRAGADPEQLPEFRGLVEMFQRRSESTGWLVERLAEADVPPALQTAFARQLPSRRRGQYTQEVHMLLEALLEGPVDRLRHEALAIVRARQEVRYTHSPACRCSFGIYPEPALPGLPLYLVAFTGHSTSTLQWAPRLDPGSPDRWILHLEDASGSEKSAPKGDDSSPATALVHRLESRPDEAFEVLPSPQSNRVVRVVPEGPDPPAAATEHQGKAQGGPDGERSLIDTH